MKFRHAGRNFISVGTEQRASLTILYQQVTVVKYWNLLKTILVMLCRSFVDWKLDCWNFEELKGEQNKI